MKALEIVEVVREGEIQLGFLRRQINRIHSGAKVLTSRKIEQMNALLQTHKETAHEIAVLINN